MKKLIILLFSALSLTAFAQQKKVAVYVTGEQSGVSKVLGDQLVAAFAKSGRYTAIERTANFLTELSKEQNYQRSGAVNDNDIARLGVQFGVNYVCVAEMVDAFGEKYVSARLIDVETAEVVNAHNVSGEMNSMNVCVQMASEIAANLSKGTFAEQAEEARLAEEARRKAAEEARRKAAEEARLAEERQMAEINRLTREDYVNLGLPSGTLWKDKNEAGGFYTYDQAVSRFGSKLPTKGQWEELKNSCRWTWQGNGYKVVGPNGNSIFLPAAGYRFCDGSVSSVGSYGSYWSSTPYGSGYAWSLNFNSGEVCIYYNNRCRVQSVRLVQ